jgi:hypothetical protein
MTTNVRAFVLGTAVVVIVFGLTMAAASKGFGGSFPFAWASLPLGGFVAAYTASSRKLLLATSLAIPASIGLALFNFAWNTYGSGSDFKGLGGSLGLLTGTLIISAPLAFSGGFLGSWLTRGTTPNEAVERTRER